MFMLYVCIVLFSCVLFPNFPIKTMKLYCFMSVLSAFFFVTRLHGFLFAYCGLVSVCCLF